MIQLLNRTAGFLLVNAFLLTNSTAFAQTTFEMQSLGQSLETYGASWGYINADNYPDLFISNHRVAATLYVNNGDGTFQDRSNLLVGHNGDADTHGAAWADFDDDGDQDLYIQVGGSKAHRPNQQGEFFINDGNRLVRQNGHELVYGEHRGRVSVWFDPDNDGDLDIAMLGYPPPGNNSGKSAIFTQNSSHVFSNRSGFFGFSCDTTLKFGLLTDLTRNGGLDLVCGGPTFPTKIYQTNGNNPFINKTGIVGPRFSAVVDAVSADFDGDQDNDVVLVRRASQPANAFNVTSKRVKATAVVNRNDEKGTDLKTTGNLNLTFYTNFPNSDIFFGANKVHLNLQQIPNTPGKVYTVTLDKNDPELQGLGAYNVSDGVSASEEGIYIGYFQGAGEWRLRVVSRDWSRFEYNAVSTTNITGIDHIGYDPDNDALSLKYLSNNGASGFSDKTNAAGLSAPITARSIVSADFDNDMDRDIFVVCEHEPMQCQHYLYSNNGNGSFTRSRIPTGNNGLSESAVSADYNLDGCVDVAIANGWFNVVHGASDHLLYRNSCNNGNIALEIDLVGTQSNRDGTGATVEVTAGGVTQFREQGNIHHRFSQNDDRLHFGLANNTSARVVVRWPSGQTDTHTGVAAGSLYKATEGGNLQAVQALSANSLPRLFVSDITVNEFEPSAQVAINLIPANNANNVSVNFTTQNGTAQAPHDYTAQSGSRTFQPGQTQKIIAIPIINDLENESTEVFTLQLSAPVNAVIGDGSGRISILDNDSPSTGTECGKPNFNKNTEIGLFIWKDCTVTASENWLVRTTGGNSASLITYEGLVSSNQNFSSVSAYRLESNDNLNNSNRNKISYLMKMVSNGIDGFNFRFNTGASVCFDPFEMPSSAKVYLGSGRTQMNGKFNLQDLGACP